MTETYLDTYQVPHTVCLPSPLNPEERKVAFLQFLLQVSTIPIQFYKSCKRFSSFAREEENESIKLQDPLKRDIYAAGSLEQMQEQQDGRRKIIKGRVADW